MIRYIIKEIELSSDQDVTTLQKFVQYFYIQFFYDI